MPISSECAGAVQTTHKISGDQAQGYATYLTSTSSRGDYYTGDGEVQAGSRWHGSQTMLASLGLEPDGHVGRDELRALMQGVSPLDGAELRRAGGNGTRVAGIDLTFSAPKSVSALWAVSSPDDRAQIEAAHSRAVAGAVARAEREVELVRRRRDGKLQWQKADRLLAAEFVHTASRLTRDQERGGVPDPQLHSHVVVLGAERGDGRLVAVDSRELFRSARANGAWYRAELAHHLQGLGLEVRGRTGRGERYFELGGVPPALSERWSGRSSEIERAARRFRTRYGRDPRGGELGSLTQATRGGKTVTAAVDVDAAWRAVGEEYGLTREALERMRTERSPQNDHAALAGELLRDVAKDHAVVSDRDLKARAYELAAGMCHPEQGDRVLAELSRSGELIALEGGLWTTRELRALERTTLASAAARAGEQAAPVKPETLREARLQTQRQLGAPLSREQRDALTRITGAGGVSVLVGQAGTGKGTVIATASHAWRAEGYNVIGTAVAGATAKRLQADAELRSSVTTDALLHRVGSGQITLDKKTVVVMDEAGMADTRRLAAVTELTDRNGSKLLLVGDHAQLPSIGAGGIFAALQQQVPKAELTEVHRARNEWERHAWGQVRSGEATRALAAYAAHDRLHLSESREQAARHMIDAWECARRERPEQQRVMLTDASNAELEAINALAQERRAQAGELGSHHAQLPGRPYRLAAGDEVMLTAALYPRGEQRLENGTVADIIDTRGENGVTIRTNEAPPREVALDTREFSELRLAYAQHVYKAQGRTVDQAFVLMGGWQSDRENAYVALTRAREQTDIYVCRDELGEQGMEAGAIERLSERIEMSNAQQPSIAFERRKRGHEREMHREQERDEREHDRDPGIEL
ncbi:MAG TPA: MobF family relaxase [Solirubrobacteraceae bacterium]|nr:MobF family relaxase [Solirubrobacteraceae bacterium]